MRPDAEPALTKEAQYENVQILMNTLRVPLSPFCILLGFANTVFFVMTHSFFAERFTEIFFAFAAKFCGNFF